jgi:hypothetical protein
MRRAHQLHGAPNPTVRPIVKRRNRTVARDWFAPRSTEAVAVALTVTSLVASTPKTRAVEPHFAHGVRNASGASAGASARVSPQPAHVTVVGIVRGRTLPPPASDKLAGETAELLVDQLANEELELAATLLNSGGDDLDELHESKRTTGLQGTQARGIYIGMPAVPVRGLSGKDGPHG